jgi:hypothetical protein
VALEVLSATMWRSTSGSIAGRILFDPLDRCDARIDRSADRDRGAVRTRL